MVSQFGQFGTFHFTSVPQEFLSDCINSLGNDCFPVFVFLQGKVVIWAKKDERIDIPDGEIIKDQVDSFLRIYFSHI